MLDHTKTGKFIAEQRKKLGLTQRQLADKLCISDKAVSKWETGKSFPDSSLISDICGALNISVNDLLAGEHIDEPAYQARAEENLIDLIEYGSERKKDQRYNKIGIVTGILCLIFFFILTNWYIDAQFIALLDIPSLLLLFSGVLAVLLICGKIGSFFRAFIIVFHPAKDYDERRIESSLKAVKTAIKSFLVIGFFSTLVPLILLIGHSANEGIVLSEFAVVLLPLVYSLACILLLIPIESKIEDRQ